MMTEAQTMRSVACFCRRGSASFAMPSRPSTSRWTATGTGSAATRGRIGGRVAVRHELRPARRRVLLRKIDEALDRLKAGSVDQCEDCEGDRLRAAAGSPVTTLCIGCKEKREDADRTSETLVSR